MNEIWNGQAPMNEGPGNALTDTDYPNLARRWIDRQLAEAARIRRVDSNAGRLLVGRRDQIGRRDPETRSRIRITRAWRADGLTGNSPRQPESGASIPTRGASSWADVIMLLTRGWRSHTSCPASPVFASA